MGKSERPEHTAPPEIFYNEDEARKYTSNSRMIEIQSRLTERAVELLALPQDGAPKMLLDVGCGSGLSGEQLTELVGSHCHKSRLSLPFIHFSLGLLWECLSSPHLPFSLSLLGGIFTHLHVPLSPRAKSGSGLTSPLPCWMWPSSARWFTGGVWMCQPSPNHQILNPPSYHRLYISGGRRRLPP